MGDLIRRQEAIDAIDEERKQRHLFNTAEDGLLEARRIINTLPSAQPELQWIPCSEGLPFAEYGEGDRVYCYCHDEKRGGKWAEILYFNGGVWCRPTGETFDYKVLAWYPLPTKPYRAERREDE